MAATFKIFLGRWIPESWFLQLSKSSTIGIFLQKFDNYWKREMCFDLYAFCNMPAMLRPLHFLSQDCDISLWLNAHFLWNPVQSLSSGSSSPPSHPNLNLLVKDADISCEASLFLSPHFVMAPICLSRLNSTSFSELGLYIPLPPLRFSFFLEQLLNWEGKQLSLS